MVLEVSVPSVFRIATACRQSGRFGIEQPYTVMASREFSRFEMRMKPQLSLFFFSADSAERENGKYLTLLECAKFADQHRFAAVWTPERHFQRFGGLYGSPSITGAALAVLTTHISIRAGSVVLPLP